MEAFLHFVWQNRLYQRLIPKRSIEGKAIEVLDVGTLNRDAGADFLNAKIRIDGLIWVGAVEIHRSAHEWYEHRHNEDPTYNNVILHIVEQDDCLVSLPNGNVLPCCQMSISADLKKDIENFFKNQSKLPCGKALTEVSEQLNHKLILTDLAQERLEAKVSLVQDLWQKSGEDWAKTLYLLLMRYFGFGINNDVMEYLARSLDLRLLLKHSPFEQEALLLGQAGLIPQVQDEAYAHSLQETYDYLSYKYQLEALSPNLAFKRLRTRPKSFPLVRLRQFIDLLGRLNFGADVFEACRTNADFTDLLRYGSIGLSQEEKKQMKTRLSKQTAEMLVINVVVAFLTFSEGQLKRKTKIATTSIWSSLPAENNRITRLFMAYGLPNAKASDSQALLHLHKEYCEKKKCFFCPYGRLLLTK